MSILVNEAIDMSFKISWEKHLLCALMAYGISFIINFRHNFSENSIFSGFNGSGYYNISNYNTNPR